MYGSMHTMYRLKYGFVEKCPSRRRGHFSTKPYFNILIEHNTAKRMSGINLVILPALKLEFQNQFVSLHPDKL